MSLTLNQFDLMNQISTAMKTTPYYLMVTELAASELVLENYAEQNLEMFEQQPFKKKMFATRLTTLGISIYDAYVANNQQTQQRGPDTMSEVITSGDVANLGNVTNTDATDAKKVSKPRVAPVIELMAVEALPERVRQSYKKPIYPFDDLQVGGSFVVKVTPDRPTPSRSMQTTISQANKRLAPKQFFIQDIDGNARIWRKADAMPASVTGVVSATA